MKDTEQPLHAESLLSDHFRLLPIQRAALKNLGLHTVRDLLYHFPSRYGDTAEIQSVESVVRTQETTPEIAPGEVVIFGRISKLKTSKGFRTKIAMAEATITDESGEVKAVWFNQPYIAKMVADGALVRVQGKISVRKKNGERYFSNPKIEMVNKVPIGVGQSLFGEEGAEHTLYPVYPESRGITSNWMYHAIQKIFSSGVLDTVHDPLSPEILERYHLPSLKTALIWMHTPKKLDDAETAKKRFAFEEIFFLQLVKQKEKRAYQANPAYHIDHAEEHIRDFTKRFSFALTESQNTAINAILGDFKRNHAMSRLLEGDVGSGKTAVAASTAYAVVTAHAPDNKYRNLQVAYMCPTEILATQHFESFIKYFDHLPINIGLITSSGCRKFPSKVAQGRGDRDWTDISRAQLLKWVATGQVTILIGTHSLIQKTVNFQDLAYVIIDEQHRFGTRQRKELAKKARPGAPLPHLLSMTATPIPRTLALTLYGDLDLTLLDQMPSGRKSIITDIVMEHERKATYEKIRKELLAGRQAYVICPRIDEPDPTKEAAVYAKSVKKEAARLKKDVFPEFSIDVLHGKMNSDAKDKAMLNFKNGKTDILVATSVVEVGVNVENASIIIIEGGERFGLAQLHQLRGRVIRGNHQPFCYVFAETKSEKTIERLRALKTAKNGFELAEYDLKFRGSGDLFGKKQWGVTDVAMEALQNLKLVEAARNEVAAILDTDPELHGKTPAITALRDEVTRRKIGDVHLE